MVDSPNSSMVVGRQVDKVRASHDGHAFHEIWAARSALELLPPATTLSAIALEGFSTEDEEGLPNSATEIADLVRYHGAPRVADADRVEVLQFKYSVAKAELSLRAADIASTLEKFAQTEISLCERHSLLLIRERVRYEFVTNRPIHKNLIAALNALQNDEPATEDIAHQAKQIATSLTALGAENLSSFLHRLEISGTRGSVADADRSIRKLLADWSSPGDPESEIRLLKLRNLVREKVSIAGDGRNLINRVAVLAELQIDHESVLYPTAEAFPPVGTVVPRPFVADVIASIATSARPMVVHSAGGLGKTVLLQAVAQALRSQDFVLLFDGFGAGRWRDPADGRERAERTLVHLGNVLAGAGLCDILLPKSDEQNLLRAFRARLEQSVRTARRVREDGRIVIILDAIDHAAIQAEATHGRSFAHLLLQSLSISPIAGVAVIASCRSERLKQAIADVSCQVIEIPIFSDAETAALVLSRDPSATDAEIAALRTRSGRNPRCLDALVNAGRPYDISGPGAPGSEPSQVLNTLLLARIDAAKENAKAKGASETEIQLMLGGLALLPPPVPLGELAAAHGLHPAEAESFTADLSPLLERTPYGVMFRDEPTETLIRSMAEIDPISRDRVVENLLERQIHSSYAARALPVVLTSMKRTDALIALAFDGRVPQNVSQVSERNIRLARILAAITCCAADGRNDDLIRLLLEAAVVASGHARSDRFLYQHPDLVAISEDAEALGRLFDSKVGWPGGRHAALAIANAFVGDNMEARRNSRRAIDWHNWYVGQESGLTGRGGVRTALDSLGFAYVETLAKGGTRIARWLDRHDEDDAFDRFCGLLDLLERHVVHAPAISKRRDQLLADVLYCRLKSRALMAAAIIYSRGFEAEDRSLIERLSRLHSGKDGTRNHEVRHRNCLPNDALLVAAAKAVALKMPYQAIKILDQVSQRSVSTHDFDTHWPSDSAVERLVITAGLRAALRRRPPNLLDLAPHEVLSAIAPSSLRRGPAIFARALQNLLKDPPAGAQRRRTRKQKLAFEQRQHINQTLRHRVEPLLPYAQIVSDLATSAEPSKVLHGALNRLIEDTKEASNYPYRDGKAYIARTAFLVLFRLSDAIGAIDKTNGDCLVAWLKEAPGIFVPTLSYVVGRLSRIPATHESAIRLATHVAKLIAGETDIDSRIEAYGALARNVWRISRDEATAYFRRGLSIADAIGSNDFDRTNCLLQLAGACSGGTLKPQAAHDLARIFELNLHDADKFPWVEYAEALGRAAGIAALAIATRLDDRKKAALHFSLPPLLTSLVKHKKLPADLATALIGLAEPVEGWLWKLSDFAELVVPLLPSEHREWAFNLLLIEMDRTNLAEPWSDTLRALDVIGVRYLPLSSPSLERLAALIAEIPPKDVYEPTSTALATDNERLSVDLDFTDSAAIEGMVAGTDEQRSRNRWLGGNLNELARRPATPDERKAFLAALVASDGISVSEKLRSVEDRVPIWAAESASLSDMLPQFAQSLVVKHVAELIGVSWDVDYSWRRLSTVFGVSSAALVPVLIRAIGAGGSEIDGDGWLSLAALISADVAPDALRTGLERFLGITGAMIPPEVGDGAWSARFAVDEDVRSTIAELLWVRLGHHEAEQRWRAAHAVCRLAECGRGDIIELLVGQFNSERPSAFCDVRLPFYVLHARLWLLIALARIAKKHPHDVIGYRTTLERIATDVDFPHVGFRLFASQALDAAADALGMAEAATVRANISKALASPFPPKDATNGPEGRYVQRPDSNPEPSDSFHLDYDFNKHFVARLADTFGFGSWYVEDQISAFVRDRDVGITSMYACSRVSDRDYNIGSWSSGGLPEVDRYGGYLGWHGLMVAAGSLLLSQPVRSHRWREDPWGDFLEHVSLSRDDGVWLSELTDFVPPVMRQKIAMPESGEREDRIEDRDILAPVMRFRDDKVPPDLLVVSGCWKLSNHLTITVRSVLSEETHALPMALAAITTKPFFRWLPHDAKEVDDPIRSVASGIVTWIRQVDRGDRRIDRYDPYASPTALRRPAPEAWVREAIGMIMQDSVGRKWGSVDGSAIMRADAWGGEGGRGDYSWDRSGEWLCIRPADLRTLLKSNRKVLVGLVTAQQYLPDKSRRSGSGDEAFTQRTLAFIIDHRLRVRMPVRIPMAVHKAVKALDSYSRNEFEARFNAIRRTLGAKIR